MLRSEPRILLALERGDPFFSPSPSRLLLCFSVLRFAVRHGGRGVAGGRLSAGCLAWKCICRAEGLSCRIGAGASPAVRFRRLLQMLGWLRSHKNPRYFGASFIIRSLLRAWAVLGFCVCFPRLFRVRLVYVSNSPKLGTTYCETWAELVVVV